MKKILIFILLVLCVVPLFAVTSFYKQLPAMFLVDLASGNYYSHTSSWNNNGVDDTNGGTSTGRYNGTGWRSGSINTNEKKYYYDDQIIAVLGVTDADRSLTFTVEVDSWLYLLDTGDTTISRPYGLDLILKGRQKDGTEVYANYENAGPVVHLGLQGNNTSGTTPTPTMIEGKYVQSFTVSKDDIDDIYTEGTVWFDVCLVLPEIASDGTCTVNNVTYTAKSSDSVYSSRIKISVDGVASYILDMTGTYKSSSSSSTDTGLKSMMNVIPTAAAKSIGIKGSENKKIKVADYSYLTESKYIGDSPAKNYYTKNAYIFLSSSSAQGTNGGKFKLRRENGSGGYDADSAGNSVTFTAYISSDGSNYTSFDGTTTYSSSNTGSYFTATRKQEASQNTQEYVRWYSEGSIYIEITPDTGESIGSLLGGKYTETIYIHVVSPE